VKLAVRAGGGLHAAPRIHVRIGGVAVAASRAWVRTGGAIKQFYASLTLTLSKLLVLGRGNSATIISIKSGPVTVTVGGTVGSVTYAWERTAPDGHAWTIDNPTSATTTFSTDCGQGEQFNATFICTVRDQAGQVVPSATVTANCANIYYGGGYEGSHPPGPGEYYP
jgi:hypothetical protein